MNEIIYITACKCEIPKSKLMVIKNGRHGKKYSACREHRGKVIKRKRSCSDCGEFFFLSPLGPGGKRCPVCSKQDIAKKRRIKNQASDYIRPPRPRKNVWETTFRGDYCRSLMVCRDKESFDCDSCDRFFPVFRGIDPGRLGVFI